MASGMRFLIPFLGLVTAGCFVPPALTIANFAADTMIYLATGKGTACRLPYVSPFYESKY